jgi:hypothetical protein
MGPIRAEDFPFNSQQAIIRVLTPDPKEITPIDFTPIKTFFANIRKSYLEYINTPICGGCSDFQVDRELTIINNLSNLSSDPYSLTDFRLVGRCTQDGSTRHSFCPCTQNKK